MMNPVNAQSVPVTRSSYAIGPNGDTYLVNGQIARVYGDDQIAQDIATKLKTFSGSYFLDDTVYVPYFQTILEKPIDTGLFDSIIRSVIYSARGVSQIVNYQSSVDTVARKYFVNFSVITVNSKTPIQLNQTFGG